MLFHTENRPVLQPVFWRRNAPVAFPGDARNGASRPDGIICPLRRGAQRFCIFINRAELRVAPVFDWQNRRSQIAATPGCGIRNTNALAQKALFMTRNKNSHWWLRRAVLTLAVSLMTSACLSSAPLQLKVVGNQLLDSAGSARPLARRQLCQPGVVQRR